MRHITAEQLVEQILENSGKSDSLHELQKGPQHAAQLSHEGHLSECRECAELKGEIEVLIHELLTDISYEPPPELVQWGMTLFQPLIQPQTGSKLRKLIAALVFDTFELRLQPGVRGVAAPARQLLFRAGDVDIDVRIESMEKDNRISMVGQVLSSTERLFDGAPVKLESHGVIQRQTITNQVGEFSFDEVPKDTYHLSVDLPEGHITLFCVHRGSS